MKNNKSTKTVLTLLCGAGGVFLGALFLATVFFASGTGAETVQAQTADIQPPAFPENEIALRAMTEDMIHGMALNDIRPAAGDADTGDANDVAARRF